MNPTVVNNFFHRILLGPHFAGLIGCAIATIMMCVLIKDTIPLLEKENKIEPKAIELSKEFSKRTAVKESNESASQPSSSPR